MYKLASINTTFQQLGLYSLIGLSTMILFVVSGVLPVDNINQALLWSCDTIGLPLTVAQLWIDYQHELSAALTLI